MKDDTTNNEILTTDRKLESFAFKFFTSLGVLLLGLLAAVGWSVGAFHLPGDFSKFIEALIAGWIVIFLAALFAIIMIWHKKPQS